MQHVTPIYVAVILAAAILIQSEAKRGCASYGHSCYGGHGKRSELPRGDSPLTLESNQINPFEKAFASNKEIVYPNNNDVALSPLDVNTDWRRNSKNELSYALYMLFRQWVEETKKFASSPNQQTADSEIVFKNNYV